MRDIAFYYFEDTPLQKINALEKQFPNALFVQLGKNYNFIVCAKLLVEKITTNSFWLIPADIELRNTSLEFNVPDWDLKYVHHQTIEDLNLFLIPKNYNIIEDEVKNKFFKDVKFVDFNLFYKNYDVFFISYKEKTADINYTKLLAKCPYAKRISNIKGIFNAHLRAAIESSTNFFWAVDADAEITDNFKFDYKVPDWDFDVVHIWSSKNPVNGLVYGNGGVKLIPKHLMLDADPDSIDITTSIGANIKVIDEISNYNNFATGPFAAWRSAFRECAKLASATISRQVQEETNQRLSTWRTVGADTKYGQYVIDGANAGYQFGKRNKENPVELKRINDWDWLEAEFNFYQQAQ